MADEDNVLFIRGNNKNNVDLDTEDIWDDTALIKAYDKAVNLAKDEVAKRMGIEGPSTSHGKHNKSQNHKQNRDSSKPYKKWVVGSPCRAVYSEDGELYEAVVAKIHEDTCIVQFIGYHNSEEVRIDSLAESKGLQSQIRQEKVATEGKDFHGSSDAGESAFTENLKKSNAHNADRMECDTDQPKRAKNNPGPGPPLNSLLGMIPPAPPLPPQLMSRLPETDADALSSMLMSWYISGFHTGYYHGLKQAKVNQEKRKK